MFAYYRCVYVLSKIMYGKQDRAQLGSPTRQRLLAPMSLPACSEVFTLLHNIYPAEIKEEVSGRLFFVAIK